MEFGRGWRALKRVPELYDMRDILQLEKWTAKMSWLCLWHPSHACILCHVMSTPHFHGGKKKRKKKEERRRRREGHFCLFLLVFCFLCTNHVTPLTLVGHHTCMKGICHPHLFFWVLGNTPPLHFSSVWDLSLSLPLKDPFSHALLCTNKPWEQQAAVSRQQHLWCEGFSLSLSLSPSPYPKNIPLPTLKTLPVTTCALSLYKRSHTDTILKTEMHY